jgi:hypothetical protein
MKRHVVMVAVSKYHDSSFEPLPGVRKDAEYLRHVLHEHADGGIHRDEWLGDGHATKDEIISALRKVAKDASVTDQVILYFGGHGVREPDKKGKDAYSFVPYGATLNGPDELLKMTKLGALVEKIQAKNLILVFDFCHSGGMAAGLAWSGALEKTFEGWSNVFGLAASRGYEDAHEDDTSGFFVHELAKALEGGGGVHTDDGGRITIQDAWATAARATQLRAQGHGLRQNPTAFGSAGLIYVTRVQGPRDSDGSDSKKTLEQIRRKLLADPSRVDLQRLLYEIEAQLKRATTAEALQLQYQIKRALSREQIHGIVGPTDDLLVSWPAPPRHAGKEVSVPGPPRRTWFLVATGVAITVLSVGVWWAYDRFTGPSIPFTGAALPPVSASQPPEATAAAAPQVLSASLDGQDLRTCTQATPCTAQMFNARHLLNLRLEQRGYACVFVRDSWNAFPQPPGIVNGTETANPISFGGRGRFRIVVITSVTAIDCNEPRIADGDATQGYFDVQ